ncbi:MAG: hypothetical protein FD170_1770 [Bacteroidetes bacterium]|nr:MAG: hypothetical protein FD170_1770 [Bacteroidota bacterium]
MDENLLKSFFDKVWIKLKVFFWVNFGHEQPGNRLGDSLPDTKLPKNIAQQLF